MEENLLEVRNISVTFKSRYGVLKALDNLSLNVKKGEILDDLPRTEKMRY